MIRGAALLMSIAVVAACDGGKRRPPYADSDQEVSTSPDTDEEPTLGPLPTTGDGPCETVIEVPIVKPNFYFVLDASGSMIEDMVDSTESRYRTAVGAIRDMLEPMQARVNFGAALFPNSFNGASCEAGNEVFKLTNGSSHEDEPVALNSLITTLQGYIPEGGSPVSPTLHALAPTLRKFEGETFVVLLSDGAPNCNLSKGCEAAECILNIENAAFDDGTTCNDELNCCAPGWFPHLCLDSEETLKELESLTGAGISTYIIGLPGGVAYADLLNQMAIAGGTARERSLASDAGVGPGAAELGNADGGAVPDDGLLYYQATDAKSLGNALALVRQDTLVDCTLELDFAPTAVNLVEVTADGELLTPDAWRMDAEGRRVELLGATCTGWKTGEITDVRVRQSCRGEVR
jgi:hypothetical protein